MPGLVVSIAVAPGQEVKAGETLAVVEAMKMENVLRAERDGTVKAVFAKTGRQPRGGRGDIGVCVGPSGYHALGTRVGAGSAP